MKKEKFYWKLVRECNGKYYSTAVYCGKYCLEYKIGEEIVAPKQGIFVFQTRKCARKFQSNQKIRFPTNKYKIIKVKATGIEVQNPIFYNIDRLESNITFPQQYGGYFPVGSKCFKSIIPIAVSH